MKAKAIAVLVIVVGLSMAVGILIGTVFARASAMGNVHSAMAAAGAECDWRPDGVIVGGIYEVTNNFGGNLDGLPTFVHGRGQCPKAYKQE